jgi:hypothetical protein
VDDGTEAWLRCNILFRSLLQNEDIGPDAEGDFFPVATAWAKTWPAISTAGQDLGTAFIKKWFFVGNPTLLPVLLNAFYHYAIVNEGGAEAATFRLSSLSRDPTLLGRPTGREGRNYFHQVQERRRSRIQSDVSKRVDVVALWRFAEVWVLVRHKLVPSLPSFINGQVVRPYHKQNGEPADFSTRLRTWRRELQEYDKVLDYRDWSTAMR